MRQYVRFSSLRQFCIKLWNMAGTLHSSKGMWSYLKKPRLPTVNVVYCFDSSSFLICQTSAPGMKKWPVLTWLSSDSWILGNGWQSFFMQMLRWWKSIQKHRLPSFFQTSSTALHHTLYLRQIMPESDISHRCAQPSSTNGGGMCLNFSWNGASSVTLITCSVIWVQLSSQGSKEKMSWYSAKSEWVDSTRSRDHDSKLLNSNFSNSFCYLCSVVSFCVWMPWASSNSSIMPGYTCSSGNQLEATTLTTGIFFFRVWGYDVLFLITMAISLLPLHIPV